MILARQSDHSWRIHSKASSPKYHNTSILKPDISLISGGKDKWDLRRHQIALNNAWDMTVKSCIWSNLAFQAIIQVWGYELENMSSIGLYSDKVVCTLFWQAKLVPVFLHLFGWRSFAMNIVDCKWPSETKICNLNKTWFLRYLPTSALKGDPSYHQICRLQISMNDQVLAAKTTQCLIAETHSLMLHFHLLLSCN